MDNSKDIFHQLSDTLNTDKKGIHIIIGPNISVDIDFLMACFPDTIFHHEASKLKAIEGQNKALLVLVRNMLQMIFEAAETGELSVEKKLLDQLKDLDKITGIISEESEG